MKNGKSKSMKILDGKSKQVIQKSRKRWNPILILDVNQWILFTTPLVDLFRMVIRFGLYSLGGVACVLKK